MVSKKYISKYNDCYAWNTSDNIMNELPKTNNAIEGWHSVRKVEEHSNTQFFEIIIVLKK